MGSRLQPNNLRPKHDRPVVAVRSAVVQGDEEGHGVVSAEAIKLAALHSKFRTESVGAGSFRRQAGISRRFGRSPFVLLIARKRRGRLDSP